MFCRRLLLPAIWSGLLTASLAAETGWDLGLDLKLEGSARLARGSRSGQALHGLAMGYAEWNSGGSGAGRPDYVAYGSVLAHAGHGPTERFLGDFLAVSNMEAYSSTRLYTCWLEARHRDWSLRGGALLADEEFAGTKGGGNFLNSAFGWPAFISANTVNTGPAFYVPALGLRLEHACGKAVVWRIGIYDGDTFDSPDGDPRVNRHGVRFHSGGDQGWFVITEADWKPDRCPFRFKAGLWLHTARFSNVRDDVTGQPFAHTGSAPREHATDYGGYLAVEFELERGLQVFLRGGMAPADRNTLSWALDAGLSWTGIWAHRPADVAYLGVVQAGFSSNHADSVLMVEPAAPAPDYERVLEAGYIFALSKRWSLQPDLQLVRHLGGSPARRDTMVFLLRANVSY